MITISLKNFNQTLMHTFTKKALPSVISENTIFHPKVDFLVDVKILKIRVRSRAITVLYLSLL